MVPDAGCFGRVGASAAGLSGCAPCRLCRHGHSASIPHAFAPAALRASLASGESPADYPRRATLGAPRYRRTGCAGSARPAPRRDGRGAGEHAGTCCGRLCKCVPSSTLAVRTHHVHEGRFTDNPPGIAMELPRHASTPAPQGAVGAFSLVIGWLTWPASAGEPEQPSCGDAEPALSPCGAVRPKASLCCCESWRWRGCASGFMAATVQRKQFPLCCADSSRDKFFSPPGSPLRFDRKRCSQPVPRRPDHNKDAMGANLVQP